MDKSKKFILIDGNLLLFKSFYALGQNPSNSNLTTHLFFKTILELIKIYKPSNFFVAFDAKGDNFRKQLYPEYKAKRLKTPQELFNQKEIIITILKMLNICVYEQEGAEADDLIGTIVEKFKNDFQEKIIVSDDNDLLQLVDKNVCVLKKDKKTKSFFIVDENNFYNLYSLNPLQIIDFKAIAGDSSDNLKGIEGIGKITAIKLINKYNNLENIYQNIDQLSIKEQQKFLKDKENAFLCKKLATINKNVVINQNLDFNLNLSSFNKDLFIFLEKNNLNKLKEFFQNIKSN